MTILSVILALMLPTSEKASERPYKRFCDFRCVAVRPYDAKLNRMHRCESPDTGWFANTGNGYFGGLQFDLQTWRSVGGKGYPHQNSILEQKYRAVRLIRQRGFAPWPHCGYV